MSISRALYFEDQYKEMMMINRARESLKSFCSWCKEEGRSISAFDTSQYHIHCTCILYAVSLPVVSLTNMTRYIRQHPCATVSDMDLSQMVNKNGMFL